jgi:hypothetical protein
VKVYAAENKKYQETLIAENLNLKKLNNFLESKETSIRKEH